MPSGVRLKELVGRLAAARDTPAAKADVRSDERTLLLYGGLDLGEEALNEVVVEAPAGGGRRIDIEAGLTVVETKRDLRLARSREQAELQLAGYLASRISELGQRYVGILTDGAEWHLYHLDPAGVLRPVSRLRLTPGVDPEALSV